MTNNATPPRSYIAFQLWFDMQPDVEIDPAQTQWTRHVAENVASQAWHVLAHQDTAYAKTKLLCEVAHGALWPDDEWDNTLKAALNTAQNQGSRLFILILPFRSSPAAWIQWVLLNLNKYGAGLDSTTGWYHTDQAWAEPAYTCSTRWQHLDRVCSYGDLPYTTVEAQFKSLNFQHAHVHLEPRSLSLLNAPLRKYNKIQPLLQTPLKSEQITAFGADKVVYFATSKRLNANQINDWLKFWQEKRSTKFARVWAVVKVAGISDTVLISSVHYLWTSLTLPHDANRPVEETRIWILGYDLNAAEIQAEFEHFCTEASPLIEDALASPST